MTAREEDESYERFAKWQGITREQLSATSNLVLGLATGLLAFATLLLLEQKLDMLFAFGSGLTGCLLLAFSVALALGCATNRLTDFRLTAQISKPSACTHAQLGLLRAQSIRLGERTWLLFRLQIWSFAIGSGSIGLGILAQVLSKGVGGDTAACPP